MFIRCFEVLQGTNIVKSEDRHSLHELSFIILLFKHKVSLSLSFFPTWDHHWLSEHRLWLLCSVTGALECGAYGHQSGLRELLDPANQAPSSLPVGWKRSQSAEPKEGHTSHYVETAEHGALSNTLPLQTQPWARPLKQIPAVGRGRTIASF